MALLLPAHAKLNLVLRVLGRRPDGYHELETLFHQLELHDDLWAERGGTAPRLSVTADDPRDLVAAGEDNLVLRAAAAFAAAAGIDGGVRFHLHKRIPNGAGLGGGSSDAAAALRLCNALFGEPLAAPALDQLALPLGADVAFFLRGGSQWGTGIGAELAPASVPPRRFLLLVPPYGCSTRQVYENHAAHLQALPSPASLPAINRNPHRDSEVDLRYWNDLEAAAERVQPELARLRARVAAAGYGSVRMTGSGSALFLAFVGEAERRRAMDDLSGLQRHGIRLLATASATAGCPPPETRPWPGGP